MRKFPAVLTQRSRNPPTRHQMPKDSRFGSLASCKCKYLVLTQKVDINEVLNIFSHTANHRIAWPHSPHHSPANTRGVICLFSSLDHISISCPDIVSLLTTRRGSKVNRKRLITLGQHPTWPLPPLEAQSPPHYPEVWSLYLHVPHSTALSNERLQSSANYSRNNGYYNLQLL